MVGGLRSQWVLEGVGVQVGARSSGELGVFIIGKFYLSI